MKLSVNKTLSQAKRHAKKGGIARSAELYNTILAEFPGNRHARQGLAALGVAPAPPADMSPFGQEMNTLTALYGQRRLVEVVEKGNALVKEFPEETALLNILGAANAGLGRLDDAVDSFRRAIAVDPGVAEAHYNHGLALKNKGDLAAAIENYKRAIEIRPAYPEAFYNLGIALRATGDLTASIDSYRQAVKFNPGYAKAHQNLGNALRSMGDPEGALESYNHALRIQPEMSELHISQGDTLAELRRYDEAITALERALKIDSESREAKGILGTTLMRVGRLEEGLAFQDEGFGVITFNAKSGVTINTGIQA